MGPDDQDHTAINIPLSPVSSGKSHWAMLVSSAEMGINARKSFSYAFLALG